MHDDHADLSRGDVRTPTAEQSGGYESVRDSWVDAPPVATRREPPALPASIRELPGAGSAADTEFIERMLDRLAAGDYAGSLMAAVALLRRLPRDGDALDCAEMSRIELRKLYLARLGPLDRTPTLAMTPAALAGLGLDAFADDLLSRVDGLATLAELCLTPGQAPDHALRVLSELYLQGAISLDR